MNLDCHKYNHYCELLQYFQCGVSCHNRLPWKYISTTYNTSYCILCIHLVSTGIWYSALYVIDELTQLSTLNGNWCIFGVVGVFGDLVRTAFSVQKLGGKMDGKGSQWRGLEECRERKSLINAIHTSQKKWLVMLREKKGVY